MRTFSEDLKGKEPAAKRRLFTLFQRAVKAGQFPALKLLTQFEVQGLRGPRQVQDYAYTDETATQVKEWIEQHETRRTRQGVKLEDLQGMSDAELAALIQQQSKPARKRTSRKQKTPTRTAPNDSQIEPPERTP